MIFILTQTYIPSARKSSKTIFIFLSMETLIHGRNK